VLFGDLVPLLAVHLGQFNNSLAEAEMGDRLATIDRPKSVGAALPLSIGGAGSLSNTISQGLSPYQVTS